MILRKTYAYPFFLMVKTIGEIFQKHSSPISGILFLGNWPKKHTHLWKGQFFKIVFFYILRPDSDSSRKSSHTNCPYFFNILIGSWPNLQKTLKYRGKSNLSSKIEFFAYLTNFLKEFQKKKGSFTQFSQRNPILGSDLQKNHFEKLTFP